MPRTFFITAFRNLLRHKVQSLINVASLALGLAVFGFTFLYVKQELSYDRAWPDADRIHRLVIDQRELPGGRDGLSTSLIASVYPQIRDYFAPQIDKSTRLVNFAARFKGAPSTTMRSLLFVDSEFQDIFRLEVVAGDLGRALSGPGFIALEEGYAATLGPGLVPGEHVVIESITNVELEYEVAAIYRLPENISRALRFEQLILISDYSLPLFGATGQALSWENQTQAWLTLKPGITTENVNAMQSTFVAQTITTYDQALGPDRNISDYMFFRWQPVTDLHFNPLNSEAGSDTGDVARVITFALVGVLVLLVGCSNSVSLSLAGAMERRREVGIRKAVGALPADIRWQHLRESVLLVLLALIPAIAMLELLLPAYQNMLPFSATIDTGWKEYLLLALIAVGVGLANGIYPALMLSHVQPEAVLKAGPGKILKGGLNLRALLVGSQFGFASMLLIGTAALYLQLAITRSQPLGFDAENVVTLVLANEQDRTNAIALRTELAKVPGVLQVVPVSNMANDSGISVIGTNTLVRESGDANDVKAQMVVVDAGFFEIMHIPLLAGRAFDPLHDNSTGQNSNPAQTQELHLVLNRAAVQALRFASPEAAVEQASFLRGVNPENGQTTHRPMRIVGVVEDNMYGSLRRRPGPEIYMLYPATEYFPLLTLKYEEAVENSLQERIQATAKSVTGQSLQNIVFAEQRLALAFIQEQNESRLLLICGGLALLLACIGLYGLAAFAIERRVKEIGVRKVMGASVKNIVVLYLWRFARPVLLANLIAWPVAAYFVIKWIERFPYQMEKSWLLPLCLGSAFSVLVIALVTVSIITIRAASAKPVQSLRYE
jgi:putative ABC transport system permease protein